MDRRLIPTPGARARSLPDCWTVGPRPPLESGAGISEEPRLRPISKEDMIIAVMGPTGAGKSSFINIATQSNQAIVGHNLDSCTQVVTAIGCRHPDGKRNVVLVDTPGFDDTRRSDAAILGSIADWLVATYNEKIILSGILYLHRISDNRMAGTPIRNLSIFRELCGQEALANVILTTTLWSEVEEVTGRTRETELTSTYWRSMLLAGSRVQRFDGSHRSAWDIIDSFISVPRPKPLQLQIEMVDQGKSLPETSAGQTLLRWFSDLIRQIRDLIRRIETQLRGIRKDDSQAMDAVEAERASLVSELADVAEQRRRLEDGRRRTALRRTFSVALESIRRRPTSHNSRSNTAVSGDPEIFARPESMARAGMAATVVALNHAKDLAEIPPVPFLKGACRLAYTVAQAVESMQSRSRALQGISQHAAQLLLAISEQAKHGELTDDAHEVITNLTSELQTIEPIVEKVLSRGPMARYFLEPAEEELLKLCEANVEHACRLFEIRTAISLQQNMRRLEVALRSNMSSPQLSDATCCSPHPHRCCSPEQLLSEASSSSPPP